MCNSVAQSSGIRLGPQGPEDPVRITSAKLEVVFARAAADATFSGAEPQGVLKLRDARGQKPCPFAPGKALLAEVGDAHLCGGKGHQLFHARREPETRGCGILDHERDALVKAQGGNLY